MKKTLLALALIGCLLISVVSCDPNGSEENTQNPANTALTTVVPSGDAETPTQSEGGGVIVEQGGNVLGQGGANSTTEQGGGGLDQGGANTEGGWGPIHTPN